LLSVDVSLAVPGLGYADTNCTCEPPDTIAAAGPTTVVEMINSAIAYYDKDTGVRTFKQEMNSFFSPLGGVLTLSDPVVVYDELAGKFAVGMLDYNTTNRTRFDFAVSNDADPTDGWTYARYDMNDHVGGSFDFADYPRLGYNADAWVVSFNMFPGLANVFDHVQTLSIAKTDLTGYQYVVPGGTSHFTMAPAAMHDARPGEPMVFVEAARAPSATAIQVDQLSDELSDVPTLTSTSIPVTPYSNPPHAAQPGSVAINTDDDRIFNAALRDGLLVAAHTVAAGTDVTHARWYEFDMTGPTPTLHQSGEIDQGPEVSTYYPAIDINTTKTLGMTFMESSPTEDMSMYVTGRTPSRPAGTMQTPVLTHAGVASYSGTRAGDYSGLTVDPSDGVSFWAASEYKASTTVLWSTGLAHFTVSPPVGILPVPLPAPAPVAAPFTVGGVGPTAEPAGSQPAAADTATRDVAVAAVLPADPSSADTSANPPTGLLVPTPTALVTSLAMGISLDPLSAVEPPLG
jgi:hypothetical protein